MCHIACIGNQCTTVVVAIGSASLDLVIPYEAHHFTHLMYIAPGWDTCRLALHDSTPCFSGEMNHQLANSLCLRVLLTISLGCKHFLRMAHSVCFLLPCHCSGVASAIGAGLVFQHSASLKHAPDLSRASVIYLILFHFISAIGLLRPYYKQLAFEMPHLRSQRVSGGRSTDVAGGAALATAPTCSSMRQSIRLKEAAVA